MANDYKAKKIGDLYFIDYLKTTYNYIRVGVWDQDAETSITLQQAIEIRRLLTDIIIKAKQNGS